MKATRMSCVGPGLRCGRGYCLLAGGESHSVEESSVFMVAGCGTPALLNRLLSTLSSLDSSAILFCSRLFSSSSSFTRSSVSLIFILLLLRLFFTARLFLSLFSRYSWLPFSASFRFEPHLGETLPVVVPSVVLVGSISSAIEED